MSKSSSQIDVIPSSNSKSAASLSTSASTTTPTTATATVDKPTPLLKVLLLGDSGVGKTCLRSQFVHHVFTNSYRATIGGDYLTTSIEVPPDSSSSSSLSKSNTTYDSDQDPELTSNTIIPSDIKSTKVNLQIWDTAGQERFNSISQAFYRGTDVVVLVYDITNYESVLSLRDWFKRFLEHCHVERPGVVIVGNKSDKVNDRCVDLEEIREIVTANTTVNLDDFVIDWNMDLREVSSKRLDVVNELFIQVAKVGLEAMSGNPSQRSYFHGFDNIILHDPPINVQPSSSKCAC
ncbi:P-loop containing nucleoside triphosphate hydrolase protein [Scheffersomyces coipomensis]|uniref:P-loop containing nucleoside triphosphate hydrolase protein n=1 Tax=Scheffersomyces coipomensis TaxID=1788519 RepID=UPI00315DBC89